MQQIQETKMIALRESADKLMRLVKKYTKTQEVIKNEVLYLNKIISELPNDIQIACKKTKKPKLSPYEASSSEDEEQLEENTNYRTIQKEKQMGNNSDFLCILLRDGNVKWKSESIQRSPIKIAKKLKVKKTVNPSNGVYLRRQETDLDENYISSAECYSAEEWEVAIENIKGIMEYITLENWRIYSIRKDFLNDDHKSTPKMRSDLMNWMSEVHLDFKFLSETFHQSVFTVDRYLQANKNIGHETLQLVGTSAMLIAGKRNEENLLPDVSEFLYFCNDSFSKEQIHFMEGDILKRLDFSFNRPSSLHFLRRFNKIAKANKSQHTLGEYLLELALLEYGICHIKPSLQAAAACCLSISILKRSKPIKVWIETLFHYTEYYYTDIEDTMAELSAALLRAETSKFQAIRKKYASSQFSEMSLNYKLKGALVRRLAR
ncbi:PREDICTED: G2/mitotic-specific cyclin-B-like, partial [Nicrophorus vespilloides]|uniref:G2/mitotic-specific cyclin-B-like n=1 Tax=Nicrophorus vespilloides TaxID=110193 RepID=A0ABM1MCQ5_NICVS